MTTKDESLMTHFIGWLYVLAAPAWVMSGLADAVFAGITNKARVFCAIVSSCLGMWAFKLVPSFVGGVFIVLCAITFGLVPDGVMLSGFGSVSFIMALSFFGLGLGVQQANVSERLYVRLANMWSSESWKSKSILLTGVFMTMSIPTVPGTGVRMDLLSGLRDYVPQKTRRDQFWVFLNVFQGAQLFSPIFLSGSTLNLVLIGFLVAQDQFRFHWMFWLEGMVVFGAIMILGHIFVGGIVARQLPDKGSNFRPTAGKALVPPPTQPLDKVTIGCVLSFCVGLATVGLHKVYPVWLALLVLLVMLIFHIIQTEDFKNKVPWDALLMLGTSSGMLSGLEYLGIDGFLATKLVWLSDLMMVSYTWFFFVMILLVWVLRFVLAHGIITFILSTILVPISYNNGVNPWCTIIMIMVLAQSWFFPYQSPEFLVLRRNMDVGEEKMFLRYNILMNVVRALAVYVSLDYWRFMGLL